MFCTYLTIYRGSKLPPFYIGSTSTKKLMSGYLGSVTSERYGLVWKAETSQNPHLFKTKIISHHKIRAEALLKEDKLQRSLNVVRSSLYVNMAYARKGFIRQGPISDVTKARLKKAWKTRSPYSEIALANRRRGQKNRKPASLEAKANMSIAQTKWIRTEEMKENMSIAAKKREAAKTPEQRKHNPMSDETKAKIRAKALLSQPLRRMYEKLKT
jgi:hypothetical protein